MLCLLVDLVRMLIHFALKAGSLLLGQARFFAGQCFRSLVAPAFRTATPAVAQLLLGWGRRVQKSVFECDLSREDLDKVCGQLEELLCIPPDHCHIYRLCANCVHHRRVLGEEIEPEWDLAVVA
jgi:CRISPR-associated protein Cas2